MKTRTRAVIELERVTFETDDGSVEMTISQTRETKLSRPDRQVSGLIVGGRPLVSLADTGMWVHPPRTDAELRAAVRFLIKQHIANLRGRKQRELNDAERRQIELNRLLKTAEDLGSEAADYSEVLRSMSAPKQPKPKERTR